MSAISGNSFASSLLASGSLSSAGTMSQSATGASGGISFTDLLSNAIQNTSNAEHAAQAGMARTAMGEEIDPIQVMTTVKKADLSLRMMLQVRNSLLQAFDEIKAMQF